MTPIKTLNSRVPGLVAHIYTDPDPVSPAEWGNLGHISYNISARNVLGTIPTSAEHDAEIARMVREGYAIGLPVWAYVHSGSTIKAAYENPFLCPWDSGRSGWVYVMRDKALKEFGRKLPSRKLKFRILDVLKGEVETFNQWLNGDVYGYRIELNGEQVDSCWGMYGLDETVKDVTALLEEEVARIAPMKQMEFELQGEKA
jgi:hypothetical protein